MDVVGIMSQLLTSQMQMIQQSAAISAIKASQEAQMATIELLQEAGQVRTLPAPEMQTRGSLVDISV